MPDNMKSYCIKLQSKIISCEPDEMNWLKADLCIVMTIVSIRATGNWRNVLIIESTRDVLQHVEEASPWQH